MDNMISSAQQLQRFCDTPMVFQRGDHPDALQEEQGYPIEHPGQQPRKPIGGLIAF
jgi:hypothetical protein